jgi:uncharacterized protein involved in propanediol utilization
MWRKVPAVTHLAPITATEVRVAGHAGELLQGRLGPQGPVALVTLPCPVLTVTARHVPGGPGLAVTGAPVLSAARALRFLAMLGRRLTGRIDLSADMPPGGGAGSSTAALVALARLAGATDPDAIARACVAVEGASDPLMFAHPARHLWASRRGVTLAQLPPPPPLGLAVGFLGAGRLTDPADHAFPDIADLAAAWPAASADPAALAALASESARRTLTLRAEASPLPALAAATGAIGFAIAHTGAAVALLYRQGAVPKEVPARMALAGVTGIRVCDLA